MNIAGKHVVLRAPENSDISLLHSWANDPEIWKLLGGSHFPYSSISTEKWIAEMGKDGRSYTFVVEAPDLGPIGTANIVNIDFKNRNAFHGMMIGCRNAQGKGFGLDTVMALMRYTFDELGLVRLDGDMIETNVRSISFYTKYCGWEIEGRKMNWFYRNGRYYDKVIVGITRDRYNQLIEMTNYWNR